MIAANQNPQRIRAPHRPGIDRGTWQLVTFYPKAAEYVCVNTRLVVLLQIAGSLSPHWLIMVDERNRIRHV